MQFRKIAAVAGSALLAGATLATAGMAATVKNVGEITTKLGTAEEPFPVFVVGAGAAASDVAAAIDIAVRLAANSKRAEPVEVTTPEVSVTGGVLLESEMKKLHFKDTIDKVVDTLTANELGDLLAPGVVEDEDGNEYKYEQYIRIGGREITFTKPTNDEDPTFVIKVESDSAKYLIQAEVVFDKALDVTRAKGKKITLFGQEFTIAPDSDKDKLVLYKSAQKVEIKAGEEKTVTVGGKTYTIKVEGASENKAYIKVNDGELEAVQEGSDLTVGDLHIYVEKVFYYEVPSKTGGVVLSLGTDKYIFDSKSGTVKIGKEEIKGVKVSFTTDPTQLSKMEIKFFSPKQEATYIKAGETWTDPVFGTIKIAFHGLDSTATEEIKVEPTSEEAYRVVFTDRRGNKASLVWAYDDDLQNANTVKLADSEGKEIKVVEGDPVALKEYTFLAAEEGFERIVKVTGISIEGEKATVTLKDIITGTEFEVKVEDANDDDIFEGEKVIDGQTYYIKLDASGTPKKVSITWADSENDTGVGAGDPGSEIRVYPIIRTSKGAIIALTDDVTITGLEAEDKIILPTGTLAIDNTGVVEGTRIKVTDDVDDNPEIVKVGDVYYVIDDTGTAGELKIALEKNQDGGSYAKGDELSVPAIMLIEEEDATNTQNAVIISIHEDTGNKELGVEQIIMTDSNAEKDISTTETHIKKYVDTYGVQITYDSEDQGIVKIIYPDTQLVAKVAVGRDPKFEKTTTEVTRDVVIPITESIARLDTEIDETIKKTRDLIVVGGPCINRIAAELLGKPFPACGEESGIPEGGAIIRVFPDKYAEGKTAVLVAGWDKEATRQAASLLQSGALEEYDAEAVKIVDSSIEEIRVEETPTEETATE